ncbi:uncharacterized protein [Asterias amurensis]|uniref:uncharacterized protein isoform X2 n=1 Tax=Asterias amurensis TaxID=7602 RepID=UPI003AB230C4
MAEEDRKIVEELIVDYACKNCMDDVVAAFAAKRGCTCFDDIGVPHLRVAMFTVYSIVRRKDVAKFETSLQLLGKVHSIAPDLVPIKYYIKLITGLKTKILLNKLSQKSFDYTDACTRLNRYFPKSKLKTNGVSELESDLNGYQLQFRRRLTRLILSPAEREAYRNNVLADDSELGAALMVSTQRLLRMFIDRLNCELPEPVIEQIISEGTQSQIAQDFQDSQSASGMDHLLSKIFKGAPSQDTLISILKTCWEEEATDISDMEISINTRHESDYTSSPDIFACPVSARTLGRPPSSDTKTSTNQNSFTSRQTVDKVKKTNYDSVMGEMMQENLPSAAPKWTHQAPAAPKSTHQVSAAPKQTYQTPAAPKLTHQAPAAPRSNHRAPAPPKSTHKAQYGWMSDRVSPPQFPDGADVVEGASCFREKLREMAGARKTLAKSSRLDESGSSSCRGIKPCCAYGETCADDQRVHRTCLGCQALEIYHSKPGSFGGSTPKPYYEAATNRELAQASTSEDVAPLREGIKSTDKKLSAIDRGLGPLSVGEGFVAVENGFTASEDGSAAIEDGSAAIEDGSTAIEDGSTAIEDGSTAIEDGSAANEDGSTAFEDGFTAIRESPGETMTVVVAPSNNILPTPKSLPATGSVSGSRIYYSKNHPRKGTPIKLTAQCPSQPQRQNTSTDTEEMSQILKDYKRNECDDVVHVSPNFLTSDPSNSQVSKTSSHESRRESTSDHSDCSLSILAGLPLGRSNPINPRSTPEAMSSLEAEMRELTSVIHNPVVPDYHVYPVTGSDILISVEPTLSGSSVKVVPETPLSEQGDGGSAMHQVSEHGNTQGSNGDNKGSHSSDDQRVSQMEHAGECQTTEEHDNENMDALGSIDAREKHPVVKLRRLSQDSEAKKYLNCPEVCEDAGELLSDEDSSSDESFVSDSDDGTGSGSDSSSLPSIELRPTSDIPFFRRIPTLKRYLHTPPPKKDVNEGRIQMRECTVRLYKMKPRDIKALTKNKKKRFKRLDFTPT